MKSKLSIILIVLLIGSLTTAAIFLNKTIHLQKEVSRLESNVDNLKDDLDEAKDKITDLEDENEKMQEQLDNVKHFDDGGVDLGYSPSSSSISYTGDALETRIDGEFEGWDGETIFKMMNGTIWQQASYAYTYHYAYMPDVLIYRKDGGYYMKVEGVDDEIRVNRIR
jgi:outer membrane murein-binding lipoprotein Lpp